MHSGDWFAFWVERLEVRRLLTHFGPDVTFDDGGQVAAATQFLPKTLPGGKILTVEAENLRADPNDTDPAQSRAITRRALMVTTFVTSNESTFLRRLWWSSR